jgi:YHS domain-containing protein
MNTFPGGDDSAGAHGASARDPVCGARIDVLSAAASEEDAGNVYYFCSHACHERFKARPWVYGAKRSGPE